MLCLCATCCSKFLHGPVVANDVIAQVTRWCPRVQDDPVAELHIAQTLKQDPAWMDLEMRVRAWKKDADKVSEQMKDAAPAAPTAEQ